MLDLLLISRCPPFPLYHGDRLIPYHLARELSARRYQISLLAFYQQPEDIAEVPRYSRFFKSVTLIREPKRSMRSYWQRYRQPGQRFPTCAEDSWSPEMWQTIQKALQTQRCDAVHVFGGVQVYEYFPLIRHYPNVIVPYESYSLWLERAVQEELRRIPRWNKEMQHRITSSYESWMFSHYDRVVVLTDRDARALRSLNPETPAIAIPNGVDIDYFTPTGYEPDEPALLFTGNYDYAPNLDAGLRLARDIFPRVKAAVPEARLYLIGGNPPPDLRAYASPDIEITGRVPDLRPYYELSTIFVSPLRLGAGIKNKILEAMAMGKPIVATPLSCDGIPALHGQNVLIAQTDEELAKNAILLLKNAKLREIMIRSGRQLVEQQFTWAHVADLYEDLYLQIIKEHKERGG